MPRQHNGGLKKRCDCPRRLWAKCPHPWHFGFHHAGREHRFSLHTVAGKPPGYWMSKSEAEAIRDRLRAEIREGRFGVPPDPAPPLTADARLTFGDVADRYLERHVRTPARRPAAAKSIENYVKLLRAAEVPGPAGSSVRLEAKPIDAITKADVEAIREARRALLQHPADDQRVRAGVKGGEIGIEHVLEMRRRGPDGREHGLDAYVFGNEVGERIGTIKTAWLAAGRRREFL